MELLIAIKERLNTLGRLLHRLPRKFGACRERGELGAAISDDIGAMPQLAPG
jgi:hypothetical protein